VVHPSRLAQGRAPQDDGGKKNRKKAMPDFIALDTLVGQTAATAPDRIAVIRWRAPAAL
jgi:hypothetical protein